MINIILFASMRYLRGTKKNDALGHHFLNMHKFSNQTLKSAKLPFCSNQSLRSPDLFLASNLSSKPVV